MKINIVARYSACIAFGLVLCGWCWAMVVDRPLFEPSVALLFDFIYRRHGSYEAGDYGLFVGYVGLMGLLAIGISVRGWATKGAVDRKIDRYLEQRAMQQGQVARSANRSELN